MKYTDRHVYLAKVFLVWGAMIFLILAIASLRTTPLKAGSTTDTNAIRSLITTRIFQKQSAATPNPSSKKRDYIKASSWPKGMWMYRDWWRRRQAAVYVVEMDRAASDLRFGVELANDRMLGREKISGMAKRLAQDRMPILAGVNAAFGIREDGRGRGGMFFNLHIQDGELVSIPPRRNRWGYSPPTAWGETSFGVTTNGEYLLDAVELNGVIHIAGQEFTVDCINQLLDAACPAVIYTPRFGERTLTRRCYEIVLTQLTLPLTGKYRSHFVIGAVNTAGNSIIPIDGIVLSLDRRRAEKWKSTLIEGASGTLKIALSPPRWQQVSNGIGGNLRLVRDGRIEPEIVQLERSRGGYAPDQSNGVNLHPRSALGFNDERLFLVTVDGRQIGYSMGMTFYELAGFLRDLGVKHAVNFDGGSSSALWGLGEIVNRPSNGYERQVFNVAMITTKNKKMVKD